MVPPVTTKTCEGGVFKFPWGDNLEKSWDKTYVATLKLYFEDTEIATRTDWSDFTFSKEGTNFKAGDSSIADISKEQFTAADFGMYKVNLTLTSRDTSRTEVYQAGSLEYNLTKEDVETLANAIS